MQPAIEFSVQSGYYHGFIVAGNEKRSLCLLRDPDTGYRKATDSKDTEGQRFVARPSLEKVFSHSPGKASRDRLIAEAVGEYGYSQREMARFLGLYYSTISRMLTAHRSTDFKDADLLTLYPPRSI